MKINFFFMKKIYIYQLINLIKTIFLIIFLIIKIIINEIDNK